MPEDHKHDYRTSGKAGTDLIHHFSFILPFPFHFSQVLHSQFSQQPFPSAVLSGGITTTSLTPRNMRTNSFSSQSAAFWLLFLALSAANCTALVDLLLSAKFIDISAEYVPGTPKYDSPAGIGIFTKIMNSIEKGDSFNTRDLVLNPDWGTHVKALVNVEYLDLSILNGPAMVVEVPKDTNITAQVMQQLNIPKGVKRVIFKTLNTDRNLMETTAFDSGYIGFQRDGAEWLVKNTDIKLIGIDYLSVGVKPEQADVYKVLGKDVIPVEGLKLKGVVPGLYFLHCLPLRLSEANAAPTRCILVQ